MTTPPARLQELITLSRLIGEPGRDLVILAEGNTSVRAGESSMLVKATGSAMADADETDFVQVDLHHYWALLDGEADGDGAVAKMMSAAGQWGEKRPSVESLLHAVCLRIPEVDAVVHTHPVAVNAVLCSDKADYLVRGSLFPDQVVVLGRHNLLVPYVDPGLPLARYTQRALAHHQERYGSHPKAIYLRNHGLFALGSSPAQAVQVTEMAVKAARVLAGALAAGEPVYLEEENAERIHTRPDEEWRRRVLDAPGTD